MRKGLFGQKITANTERNVITTIKTQDNNGKINEFDTGRNACFRAG